MNLNLKVLNDNDNYDVQDFNNNFSSIASAITTLSNNITTLSQRLDGLFVTGVLTANGNVNLGRQPKWVIVFANFDNTAINMGLHIAMAIAGIDGHQNSRSGGALTTTLQINANGFQTSNMSSDGSSVSTGRPLRYIAAF